MKSLEKIPVSELSKSEAAETNGGLLFLMTYNAIVITAAALVAYEGFKAGYDAYQENIK